MLKTSISTYSFSQYLWANKMTQLDCVAKAKELGFDGIEFVGLQPHDGSSPMEYAKTLRAACKEAGLAITNYTVGADFLKCSDLDQEIQSVKEQVDLAEALGAVSMRHDATTGYAPGERKYRGFDDALPILADACREVTRYAAGKGIRTMVENHGNFCQDSFRVEKLVNQVADENFGLLCDMGNYLCADEDPAAALGRTAPYAFYAHAKDFIVKSAQEPNPGEGFFRSRNGTYLRGTIIGHGNVPVLHCLTALKQAGYDGYVAIEFEGMEDCLLGIRVGLQNLKRYIAMAEAE